MTCNKCVIDCGFGQYRTQYTPSRLRRSGVYRTVLPSRAVNNTYALPAKRAYTTRYTTIFDLWTWSWTSMHMQSDSFHNFIQFLCACTCVWASLAVTCNKCVTDCGSGLSVLNTLPHGCAIRACMYVLLHATWPIPARLERSICVCYWPSTRAILSDTCPNGTAVRACIEYGIARVLGQ